MYLTFLIIGIVLTSIGVISITVFSISNFILKRFNKEERKQMTEEEKRKEKWFKRSLNWLKRLLKTINKKLLENLWAFYGITSVTVVGGVSMLTVGVVQKNMATADESSSSSIVSSSSVEESSSYTTSSLVSSVESISISSESSSSSELSSSSIESSSSEELSSSSELSSSEESFSSEEISSSSEEATSSIPPYYTVTYVLPYGDTYDGDEIDNYYPNPRVKQVETTTGYAVNYELWNEADPIAPHQIIWYADEEMTLPYVFDDVPLSSDIVLYGKDS